MMLSYAKVMALFVLEAHDQLHSTSRQSCTNKACKLAYSMLQVVQQEEVSYESFLPRGTNSQEERQL